MEGTRILQVVYHLQTIFQDFAELFDGCKGAFEMHHSFLYFIGVHFWINVHKFVIHLCTV